VIKTLWVSRGQLQQKPTSQFSDILTYPLTSTDISTTDYNLDLSVYHINLCTVRQIVVKEYILRVHYTIWNIRLKSLTNLHAMLFTHLVACLTTGPKPLPKWSLRISRASSYKRECPLLSLRSSSSFLQLLPRLPVTSTPPPFIILSITHCISQFVSKIWPIQLTFRSLISCRISLCSLTLK
jgi:hypothetical protein